MRQIAITERRHKVLAVTEKAQAGRKLVPSKSYRGFRFNPPPEETALPSYNNDKW
jgi:hypothetical protein